LLIPEIHLAEEIMKPRPFKELRWILRILGGIIIVFSIIMFIPESMDSESHKWIEADEILGFSVVGLGLLGLAFAWIWELIGGIVSLAAFAAFAIMTPQILSVPLMWVWPIIAILFIVLWVKSRNAVAKKV